MTQTRPNITNAGMAAFTQSETGPVPSGADATADIPKIIDIDPVKAYRFVQ